MAIDDKPPTGWTEQDLQELCDEGRREGPELEYKQELSLETDSDKQEVEKDVLGMANSGGGFVIYGIKEAAGSDGPSAE